MLFIDKPSSFEVLVKSRSSSRKLNAVARKAAAILLCSLSRHLHAYMDTDRNPADSQAACPVTAPLVSCSTRSRDIACSHIARKLLYSNCVYSCARSAVTTMQLPRSPPDKDGLDAHLCEYLEWLRHEGAHVVLAGAAISGCHFFWQKKRYFPAAWELLWTWKREEFAGSSAHWTDCFCPHCDSSCVEFNRCGRAHCHRLRWVSANDGSGHPATSPNHSTRKLHSSDLATKTGGRTGDTQSVKLMIPSSFPPSIACCAC